MPDAMPVTVQESPWNCRWILGIDTSTEQAGLAVSKGATTIKRTWSAGRTQTTSVLPAIDDILTEAGISMQGIDAIAVATGPGTFTGLRVGLSLAKGFLLAREIPLVGIPTLEIAAADIPDTDELIAVLPAGRGRVVWQIFGRSEPEEPRNSTVQELIEILKLMPDMLVTGELGTEHQSMIEQSHVQVRWRDRDPAVLVGLARICLDQGLSDDPVTLEPTYLHGVTVQAGPVQDRLKRKR